MKKFILTLSLLVFAFGMSAVIIGCGPGKPEAITDEVVEEEEGHEEGMYEGMSEEEKAAQGAEGQ